MGNEIFNFTLVSPIIVLDNERIAEVCNELYNMDIYPVTFIRACSFCTHKQWPATGAINALSMPSKPFTDFL